MGTGRENGVNATYFIAYFPTSFEDVGGGIPGIYFHKYLITFTEDTKVIKIQLT
jgi:hypothetical protein